MYLSAESTIQVDIMAQEIQANINEIEFLLRQSKQQVVQALLQGELVKQKELLKTVSRPEKKQIVKSVSKTKRISNYSWDENLKYVKIYVRDIKKAEETIEEENIEANFEERSFSVILRNVGVQGINYSLSIGNLNKDISPETCKVVTTKTGVNVHLSKVKTSMWTNLKLQKEEKKDDIPKMDKDADPSAGLMNLMKHMYATGDDEMKRTIAKSMYEAQNKQATGEASKLPDMGDMGTGFDNLWGRTPHSKILQWCPKITLPLFFYSLADDL